MRDLGEACDTTGGSCTALGFTNGNYTCKPDCTINRTACSGPSPGWSCEPSRRGDGICDCGCDAPDPDCGAVLRGSACERSNCRNSTRPALNDSTTCAIDSCANIGTEGRCIEWDTLQVCDNGTIKSVDCRSYSSGDSSYPSTYSPGKCATRFGSPTCSVREHKQCMVSTGTLAVSFQCVGNGPACVLSTISGAACGNGYQSCSAQQRMCLSWDKLQAGCIAGQPLIYDCAAFGGSCNSGQCTRLVRGALCGPGLDCMTGHSCVNGRCR